MMNDNSHDNDNDATHGYSPAHTHMKTYTAGEDNSRLANAAKELGLSMQQARQPRKQVRKPGGSTSGSMLNRRAAAVVQHLFLDTSFEDARMRAIYSAHSSSSRYGYDDVDDGEDDGYTGLFKMTTVLEDGGGGDAYGGDGEGDEGGSGAAVDAHGVEVGGDLVSACTGTYDYLPHTVLLYVYSRLLALYSLLGGEVLYYLVLWRIMRYPSSETDLSHLCLCGVCCSLCILFFS
jgi:hypothetical protein